MASVGSEKEGTISSLPDDVLKCCSCCDLFNEENRYPHLLPCLHSLCFQCLNAKIETKRNIKCTFCEEKTEFANTNIKEFPRDGTRYSFMKLFQLKNSECFATCMECEDEPPAEFLCQTCLRHLCKDCYEYHKRAKRSHVLCSVQELPMTVDTAKKFFVSTKCHMKGHEEENVSFYCYSCTASVCSRCILITHKDHKVQELQDIYETEMQKITIEKSALDEIENKISNVVNSIENEISDIQNVSTQISAEIESAFENAYAVLNRRKEDLMEELAQKTKSKALRLERQMSQLEKQKRVIANAESSIQLALSVTDSASLINAAPFIKRKLSNLNNTKIDGAPCEKATLAFIETRLIEKSPLGKLTSVSIYGPRTRVILPAVGYVGEETEIRFELFDYDGNIISDKDLEASLQLFDKNSGSVQLVTCFFTEDRNWLGKNTFSQTGRYEAKVIVFGVELEMDTSTIEVETVPVLASAQIPVLDFKTEDITGIEVTNKDLKIYDMQMQQPQHQNYYLEQKYQLYEDGKINEIEKRNPIDQHYWTACYFLFTNKHCRDKLRKVFQEHETTAYISPKSQNPCLHCSRQFLSKADVEAWWTKIMVCMTSHVMNSFTRYLLGCDTEPLQKVVYFLQNLVEVSSKDVDVTTYGISGKAYVDLKGLPLQTCKCLLKVEQIFGCKIFDVQQNIYVKVCNFFTDKKECDLFNQFKVTEVFKSKFWKTHLYSDEHEYITYMVGPAGELDQAVEFYTNKKWMTSISQTECNVVHPKLFQLIREKETEMYLAQKKLHKQKGKYVWKFQTGPDKIVVYAENKDVSVTVAHIIETSFELKEIDITLKSSEIELTGDWHKKKDQMLQQYRGKLIVDINKDKNKIVFLGTDDVMGSMENLVRDTREIVNQLAKHQVTKTLLVEKNRYNYLRKYKRGELDKIAHDNEVEYSLLENLYRSGFVLKGDEKGVKTFVSYFEDLKSNVDTHTYTVQSPVVAHELTAEGSKKLKEIEADNHCCIKLDTQIDDIGSSIETKSESWLVDQECEVTLMMSSAAEGTSDVMVELAASPELLDGSGADGKHKARIKRKATELKFVITAEKDSIPKVISDINGLEKNMKPENI